jgi:stearoyl-CoA desaturase (delta-9 desaturase)
LYGTGPRALARGFWHAHLGWIFALFRAGLVRVSLLHHVTWSVNSVCHMIGARPFASRDKAANFWPLAIASFGESWHNSHHADPTCARHGVLRGQIGISARLIWLFEKLGWVWDVRWPTPSRLARLRAPR